jgi:pteridine reductase
MDLKGRTALVTGSAMRVGRAIVLALADAGADVVIHYNASGGPAELTAAECRSRGVRAATVKAELSDPAAAREMITEAAARMGRLDVLVNSASIYPRTPYDDITDADWDANMAVNLKAPWIAARAAAGIMRRNGAGKIINIVDRAAFTPYKNYLPYIVAKAGLVALTKAMALELAPAVQVNGIAPGAILLPEDFTDRDRAEITARIPAGRIGDPADIAATVRFLCEGSDYITGQVIFVDGGRSIWAE